jgi:hypothetical protein
LVLAKHEWRVSLLFGVTMRTFLMQSDSRKSNRSESAAAALRSRVLFGAAAAVASVIGVSSSAMATTTITPATTNEWQHIMDCAKALLSDPAAHAQYCSPGHDVFVSGSTGAAGVPSFSCGGGS